MIRVLITGFGPFPGAPVNPTGELAQRLARLRRPAFADMQRTAYVFRTSYAAVDAELPKLIAKHKPDVLLSFGLATRAKQIRIETRAQNVIASLPDRDRATRVRRTIALGSPARAMAIPAQRLLAAVRSAQVPAKLSRDAGRYLCNYLCWRASETVETKGGPKLAVFVHVPKVHAPAARRTARNKPTLDDLVRAGSQILLTLSAAAKHR